MISTKRSEVHCPRLMTVQAMGVDVAIVIALVTPFALAKGVFVAAITACYILGHIGDSLDWFSKKWFTIKASTL